MSRSLVLLVTLVLSLGGTSACTKQPGDTGQTGIEKAADDAGGTLASADSSARQAADAIGAAPDAINEAGGVAIVALYGKPTDEQAFLDYYASTHAPLAATIPGLVSYRHGRVWGGSDDPPTAWYVATLTFADRAALEAGLASPEGKKTAADLANFATGGVHLVFNENVENSYK